MQVISGTEIQIINPVRQGSKMKSVSDIVPTVSKTQHQELSQCDD